VQEQHQRGKRDELFLHGWLTMIHRAENAGVTSADMPATSI
jgi:hypothetical protein